MNDNDLKYLKEEFPKYQGRMLRGDVLASYYEAERILKGMETIKKRSCGCNYASMGREVDNLYKNWLDNAEKT